MKITIIVYVYPPEHAPAGVMVHELAESLAASGHEVTVLTGWPNHPQGALFPGWRARWRQVSIDGSHRLVRVGHAIRSKRSALGRLWVYFTFAVGSFLNGLTLSRQDAVVCLSTPLFGVWAAWALARLWRARFVNVVFDLWPEAIANAGLIRPRSRLYRVTRKIDTWNLRLSDAVTTLGEGMKREMLERGLDSDLIDVVPFWIDTESIRPMPRDNAWRREQGIDGEKFVALFAGTIGYVSGAQILAETAEKLTAREDILLLVVGEGVVKDELEQLARQRKLCNMKFLPFQPAERLAEMQSTADVGLVTLRAETGFTSLPSKVLGYMAAGRAVIASAPEETDTARLVRSTGIGLVTAVQDSDALAEAIRHLADDRPRCEQMGRKARQYVLEHYSRQVVVKQYARIITRCE